MKENSKISGRRGLGAAGRAFYDRHKWDGMSDAAAGILELGAGAWDRVCDAQNEISKAGALHFLDRFDQRKPLPECGIERDSRTQVHHVLKTLHEMREAKPEEPVDEFADI